MRAQNASCLLLILVLQPGLIRGQTPVVATESAPAPTLEARGRVSNPNSEPLQGVAVEITLEPDKRLLGRAVTDENGLFRIPGIPSSGTVTIRISKKDCYTLVRKGVAAQRLLGPDPMELTIQCCESE